MVKKKRVKSSKNSFELSNSQAFILTGIFIVGILLLYSSGIRESNHSLTGYTLEETISSARGSLSTMLDLGKGTGWEGGNLDPGFAKVLLGILVFAVIFGAFKFANFPTKGNFLKILLSLIISFLAVSYITPKEIIAMMIGYNALGITVGAVLPFAAMLFISSMLLAYDPTKRGGITVGKILMELILWIFFTFIIGFKVIIHLIAAFTSSAESGAVYLLLIMLIVLTFSLSIVVWNGKFRVWIGKLGFEVIEQRAETVGELMKANMAMQRKMTAGVQSNLDFEGYWGKDNYGHH